MRPHPVQRGPILLSILSCVAGAASVLRAQTIRGTVLDEGSKLPVAAALITLIDDGGSEILPGVRSDSLGAFIVHAARAGTWRMKGVRIGYSPVMSDPVSLAVGGLAVVRLRMTTVAQQLVPVQIVEQRMLSASELMSTTGFDLRERRGSGRFLSGDRLASMGQDGVREVLATFFQPTLYVYNDPVLGDVLRLRQGASACEPEVYLDGRLLATAPEPAAVVDGPPPRTAIDSMRAQMRKESEQSRVGVRQSNALALLGSYTASALHGIEVYRASDVPPASLGAWFGMTKAAIHACGAVAVWTKAGARSLATQRSITSTAAALQVISGTLVDFDTGLPLSGKPVTLLTEGRDPIGSPATTDDRGDFTLRTGRAGELRLMAGGNEYLMSTTPAFRVSVNEMVVVKLFVSAKNGVLAPLGVAARVLPQSIGLNSIAGFTYRRERAQGGQFFRAADIERSGVRSIIDLVRSANGILVSDTPAPGTIVVTRPGEPMNCLPAYYLDGDQLTSNARQTVEALSLTGLFGVEVYARKAEIPSVFSDANACGVIAIWTKRG